MLVPFPAQRRHFSIPCVVAHNHIGTCSYTTRRLAVACLP